MNGRRAAIAQYEATVVLVVVSLSLASVVYGGLRRESGLGPDPIFVNQETPLAGSQPLERVVANSSSPTVLSSLSVDAASSTGGVLELSGSSYSSAASFCAGGATTFFSVFAPQAGSIGVSTDGRPWVSGSWGASVQVAPGWHEVMVVGGSSCSISLPGGQVVSGSWAPSPFVSSLPLEGSASGTSFTFYLPTDGGPHRVLLTSTGGFDALAI